MNQVIMSLKCILVLKTNMTIDEKYKNPKNTIGEE